MTLENNITNEKNKPERKFEKAKNFVLGFGLLCFIGWGIQYCGGSKNSSNNNSPSSGSSSITSYPKKCKAECGYPITSSTYDNDGYHMACKPGQDGKSMMDKLK